MEHIRHDRLLKSLLINWRGKGLGEGRGSGGWGSRLAGQERVGVDIWMDGWMAVFEATSARGGCKVLVLRINQNSNSYCWFSVYILKTGFYLQFFFPQRTKKKRGIFSKVINDRASSCQTLQ